MDYVDDPDEIEMNIRALEKIKDWADEQRMSLRKPHRGDMPTNDDRLSAREGTPQAGEALEERDGKLGSDGGGLGPDEMQGEHQDDPGGGDEKTILSISRPGDRMAKRDPETDDMKKWAEDTTRRLDKFGKQPVPKRR